MDRYTKKCDQADPGVDEQMENELEIWNGSEKVTSRWIRILVDFFKEIAIHQLDFASVKFLYVSYYNIADDTEWENQTTVS